MKKRALPPCGLHLELDPAATDNLLFRAVVAQPVPARVDHRVACTPSSDQGSTPQCAAYATAGLVEYWRWKLLGVKEQIDPAPIYRRAKMLDGIEGDGTTLHAAVQAAVDVGLMGAPLNLRTVSKVSDMQRAVHRYDVVISAFAITDAWSRVAKDGWLKPGGDYVGGHAVLTVGYADDDEKWWAIQNSWGDGGYGWCGFLRVAPDQFKQQFKYAVAFDVQLPGR